VRPEEREILQLIGRQLDVGDNITVLAGPGDLEGDPEAFQAAFCAALA
jgi:hypothetical protein